jgi:hypothetical protein
MNTTPDLKQLLEEIKASQQILLNTSKKHLELYAQQIAKNDDLNKQFVEMQKQSYQTQRTLIFVAAAVIVCVIIYAFITR